MPEPSAPLDASPADRREWLEEHDRYLASNVWSQRRAAVLQRDKYLCQARLDRCTQKAVQVHHLTYRHWRNEPLFDLISVCWVCHEEITRMERGDLASIVAEKESAHEQFQRMWNVAMSERLKTADGQRPESAT